MREKVCVLLHALVPWLLGALSFKTPGPVLAVLGKCPHQKGPHAPSEVSAESGERSWKEKCEWQLELNLSKALNLAQQWTCSFYSLLGGGGGEDTCFWQTGWPHEYVRTFTTALGDRECGWRSIWKEAYCSACERRKVHVRLSRTTVLRASLFCQGTQHPLRCPFSYEKAVPHRLENYLWASEQTMSAAQWKPRTC